MIILLIIFLPILISLINYVVRKIYTSIVVVIMQLAVLAACLYVFIISCFYEEQTMLLTGSVDILGIKLIVNRMSALFVLLTAFICTVLFFYTMKKETKHKLFVFLLFSMQSLMFIAFLSDDLFNIYLTLEITLLICSMLIMYKREERQLYDGLIYLLTNIIGMLFFLFGIGYIYKIFGTVSISDITERMAQVQDPKILALPYAMLMTGVCLKCAFFPLHAWLPKAHSTPGAPSVVSAVLSGIYVKCGIFLFIRIREMFTAGINTDTFFLIVGIITGLAGISIAFCQLNIKKILAYSTISQMGLILVGICLNNNYAMSGAFLHIVNHALFKSLLFLCAGLMIKSYHTNNINKMQGLLHKMPPVGIALLFAILGITGAPFFNGSISKYYIQAGIGSFVMELAIILINTGTCLTFIKVGWVLFGRCEDTEKEKSDSFTGIAVLILSVCCLLTGVMGVQFMDLILGYTIEIDTQNYFLKAGFWLLTIIICALIYKKVIKKINFFAKEHSPELSFNKMNALVLLFFGLLLSTALYITK